MPLDLSFWVPGEPATFATASEVAWRISLSERIPPPSRERREKGLFLDFKCKSMSRRGQPFDIDNLCEPVLSVLVNRKNWFRGLRSNIQWWKATLSESRSPGCQITVRETGELDISSESAMVIFDDVFDGELPRSATDPVLPLWLTRTRPKARRHGTYFHVTVGFQSDRVNIGDIATGPVKHVLDCLHPIIGGKAGTPEDWRIRILQVRKGHAEIRGSLGLRIAVLSD